jgi:hypothetical protein
MKAVLDHASHHVPSTLGCPLAVRPPPEKGTLCRFLVSNGAMRRVASLAIAVLGFTISNLGLFFLEFLSEGELRPRPVTIVKLDETKRFDDEHLARFATIQIHIDSDACKLDESAEIHISLKNISRTPVYVTTLVTLPPIEPRPSGNVHVFYDWALWNFYVDVQPRNTSPGGTRTVCLDGCGLPELNEGKAVKDGSIALLGVGKILNTKMHFPRWRDLVGRPGTYQLKVHYKGAVPLLDHYSYRFLRQHIESKPIRVTVQ